MCVSSGYFDAMHLSRPFQDPGTSGVVQKGQRFFNSHLQTNRNHCSGALFHAFLPWPLHFSGKRSPGGQCSATTPRFVGVFRPSPAHVAGQAGSAACRAGRGAESSQRFGAKFHNPRHNTNKQQHTHTQTHDHIHNTTQSHTQHNTITYTTQHNTTQHTHTSCWQDRLQSMFVRALIMSSLFFCSPRLLYAQLLRSVPQLSPDGQRYCNPHLLAVAKCTVDDSSTIQVRHREAASAIPTLLKVRRREAAFAIQTLTQILVRCRHSVTIMAPG